MNNNISAIIITKNEEKNIASCLNNLNWINERIVIDSFSEDKTKKIAQKNKAKVFFCKQTSFAEKRNLGAKKASGEWLLYVDADERVSEKLKKEILTVTKKPNNSNAYAIPRLNIFFGIPMRYGGWFPDYQTRLIKKNKLISWQGKIHESPLIKGNTKKLKNYFIHLSHLSIGEGFEKSRIWTKMEAELLFKNNHPQVKIYNLVKAPFEEFFQRVFIKKGFLDGSVGWLEGLIQAFNKFLIYSQLWELQKKSH